MVQRLTEIRVKICGITREEDVMAAVEAGADAVGFINVPGGPRYLEPGRIVELAALVPPFVSPVVVVDLTDPLDQGRAEALRFLCSRGIRTVQFHGHEPAWEIGRLEGLFGFSAIKAFELKQERDLDLLEPFGDFVDAYLADGGAGQGIACDWALADRAARQLKRPLILAGGLTPGNVGDAVRQVRPYGVDVSSGVEEAPGIKDPERIRAFIHAARQERASCSPQ